MLEPRWLIGTVLVTAIVGGCVAAGFWQLRRLDERRASNALIIERSRSVTDLPDEGFEERSVDLAFRRVRVIGTFDTARELLVRFRSRRGVVGYEVVTPLITDRGTVLVDRGWVPLDLGDRWPVESAAAPPGTLEVEGLLAPVETRGARATKNADGPVIASAVDVDDLRQELGYDRLYGLYVLADRGGSAAGAFPIPVDPPDLTEGPHRSYVVQWFSFATVGIVGWILLLRRVSSSRSPSSRRTGER